MEIKSHGVIDSSDLVLEVGEGRGWGVGSGRASNASISYCTSDRFLMSLGRGNDRGSCNYNYSDDGSYSEDVYILNF